MDDAPTWMFTAMPETIPERTKVFISYSHRDAAWLARLSVHLRPLGRRCGVEVWDDTRIQPGSRWREEIEQALSSTKVAILLVSADFIASDFIEKNELPPLLQAAATDGALILPLILSPSMFSRIEELSQFQAVNDPSRPLVDLPRGEQEAALVRLAEVVESTLNPTDGGENSEHASAPRPPRRTLARGERGRGRADGPDSTVPRGVSLSGSHRALKLRYLVAGMKRRWPLSLFSLALLVAVILTVGGYIRSRRAADGISSIAVMPFENQNEDPEIDYLCDGIPESIRSSLSQLPNLRVMSRNSVSRYKGKDVDAQAAARQMHVQTLLIGHLSQHNDSLAVSVELINAEDNSQIWSQQYNRTLADVFVLQEEIARVISEKLRSQVAGTARGQPARRPTDNIRAFEYYVKGQTYSQRRTREDLLMAISYCEKALQEDKDYALAHAALADSYGNLGVRGYDSPSESRRKAEAAARRALALDPNLAEAHAALGQVFVLFAPYDFSRGDSELRRALELSPSLAQARLYLGYSLVRQGLLDKGLEQFQKAQELDPFSSNVARGVAYYYYLKRDYVRALDLLRQANKLGPAFVNTFEIGLYIQNGLFDEALMELENARQTRKNDPLLICGTGMVYAGLGKRREALKSIKQLEELSGASSDQAEAQFIAKIYTTLNEKTLALDWLEHGLSAGAIGVFYKDDPVWDPLRGESRFAALLRRMGITS